MYYWAEGSISFSKPVEKDSDLYRLISEFDPQLIELRPDNMELNIHYREFGDIDMTDIKKALAEHKKNDPDMDGYIAYESEYDGSKGSWTIHKGEVEDLFGKALYVREAGDEILIKELTRRGFKVEAPSKKKKPRTR